MHAVREAVQSILHDAYVDGLVDRIEHESPAVIEHLQEVHLTSVPTRAQIEALEAEMRKYQTLEIVPVHYFAEGLYAREITIPAGTLLTGKVHAREHLNIVSKGEITVWTEDGMKRVKAPFTMRSRPGTKRVGLTHEETVWTTIHATTETDIAKLEAELIEPEQAALIGQEAVR